jgi:hypothetical protein
MPCTGLRSSALGTNTDAAVVTLASVAPVLLWVATVAVEVTPTPSVPGARPPPVSAFCHVF